jgi:peroxiredoxin
MAAFSRAGEKLEAEGIKVIAASTDTEEEALQSIEASKVIFPVGHSLDPAHISKITGAYYAPEAGEKPRHYLHSTNFLLSPDGKVNIALYSSGPLGRLVWQDLIPAIQHRKKRAAAAAAAANK